MLGEGRTLTLNSSPCTALTPSSGFSSPHGARSHRTRKICPPGACTPSARLSALLRAGCAALVTSLGRSTCQKPSVEGRAGVRKEGGGQGTTNSKFELGPPDGSEGTFVKIGGHKLSYLAICYLHLALQYLDGRHVGLCLPYPQQSEHFKTTSQKVARKFWWKNVKMIVLICVIVFIIILFIVLFATGAIPT